MQHKHRCRKHITNKDDTFSKPNICSRRSYTITHQVFAPADRCLYCTKPICKAMLLELRMFFHRDQMVLASVHQPGHLPYDAVSTGLVPIRSHLDGLYPLLCCLEVGYFLYEAVQTWALPHTMSFRRGLFPILSLLNESYFPYDALSRPDESCFPCDAISLICTELAQYWPDRFFRICDGLGNVVTESNYLRPELLGIAECFFFFALKKLKSRAINM